MYTRFLTFVSVVSFVVFPRWTLAQSADQIGIRAQGMAGAFTAVADDATAVWWNPAGLALGPYFNAVLETTRKDQPTGGVAVAFPAFGLSYYRLRINQIDASRSIGTESGGRQDTRTADLLFQTLALTQFGATVGQSLGEHVVVASTLKLLTTSGETQGGLDVGAMAKLGRGRVGLMVRNARIPTFGSGDAALSLDRSVRLGAALSSDRASLSTDFDITSAATPFGDERRWAVGAELWTTARVIGIRGGVSRNAVADTGTTVTGGLSIAPRSSLYVDAALIRGSDETRRGWGIALRVTF